MGIEGLGPKEISGTGPLERTKAADEIFSKEHEKLPESAHLERAKSLQNKDRAAGNPFLHKAWGIILGRGA